MKAKIATLLTAVLVLSFGSTGLAQTITANPYGVDPEHYQCYTFTLPTTFQPRNVTVRDQFGFRTVRVIAPRLLCTPVSKNNGLLADRVSHLVCYAIQNGLTNLNRRVEVTNQFGRLQFTVQNANLLCLPSLKRVLPAQ
jgi:hypothetical protein